MKRYFSVRRTAVIVLIVLLVVATFPFSGFHLQAGSSYSAYEQGLLSAGFPESYVRRLSRLHDQYPNWNFEAYQTGLDWNSSVSAECSGGRSLVVSVAHDVFKSKASGCYNPSNGSYTQVESGYVTASEQAVAYYLDPRNFLTAEYILQFESLSYRQTADELGVISQILSGSVLGGSNITYLTSQGESRTIDQSYAQVILQAGQTCGVNPFFLAAKIRNEVGSGGATISGNYSGYTGLYNFYNIYAYGQGSIANALGWAGSGSSYGRPWTNPVRSIMGGAQYIYDGYLANGQTTSYFQRFNVVKAPYYSHQYMTAISGAAQEAYGSFSSLGASALGAQRTFIIPVYENMPSAGAYLADHIVLTNYLDTGTANASVNLRTTPTTSASNRSGNVLPAGTAVTITDEVRSCGSDFLKYPYWYQVSYSLGGGSYSGYVCADYINVSYTQTTVRQGDTLQLSYTLDPVGASESPTVYSSDSGVATISSTGTVTAVGTGTVSITALLNNGERVRMSLVVVAGDAGVVPVNQLILNAEALTLNAGESFQLAATVEPVDATAKTILYSSDDPSVATVGADGWIYATGGGTAHIVAASADGATYSVCTLTVKGAASTPDNDFSAGGIVDWNTSAADIKTPDEIKAAIEDAEEADEESIDTGLEGIGSTYDPNFTLPEGYQESNVTVPTTGTAAFSVKITGRPQIGENDVRLVLKSPSDKTVATASFVEDGEFRFENILDGNYTIQATDRSGQMYQENISIQGHIVTGNTTITLSGEHGANRVGLYIAIAAVAVTGVAAALIVKKQKKHKKPNWYSHKM